MRLSYDCYGRAVHDPKSEATVRAFATGPTATDAGMYCRERNKECVGSITGDDVLAAVMRIIDRHRSGLGWQETATAGVEADTSIRIPQRVFKKKKS